MPACPPNLRWGTAWVRRSGGGPASVRRRVGGLLRFRARLARARHLRGQRRLPVDGDVGADALESLRSEAFDLHQVSSLLERAVLGAIVDDALRRSLADAWEIRELVEA